MPLKAGLERVLLLLSGEHPTMTYSEICAILDSEGMGYDAIAKHDQIFLLDVNPAAMELLGKRSAYLMEGGRLLAQCAANTEDCAKSLENIDWSFLGGKSFGARANRVRNYWRNLDTQELQGMIGGIVKGNTDSIVNLDCPEVWIKGIISDAGVFFYIIGVSTDRSGFTARRPKSRPYFHPGVLEPKLSRAFVNLSGVREGGLFVDPFCGTGGFLIEAALMGMKACGMDLDMRMVNGTGKNVAHYHLDCDLLHGDAKALPLSAIDGISTDPPYGRGTTTMGMDAASVLLGFLRGASGALKKGGKLCTAAPIELNPRRMAQESGFKVIEEHQMRVHKSLTRSIIVVERD
ncbi:MAG: RsmD family RNA methyltransferase [Candidatus Methanomethylicus sp.]|nr:RsmD family RNA methyltransferase [Candidatus Methanomethylicus sp.]